MTDKEKVLKVWPNAYVDWFMSTHEYVIWSTDDPSEKILGRGAKKYAAWQNAAESLPPQPVQKEICGNCEHPKGKHHNGRGMCSGRKGMFICSCSRYKRSMPLKSPSKQTEGHDCFMCGQKCFCTHQENHCWHECPDCDCGHGVDAHCQPGTGTECSECSCARYTPVEPLPVEDKDKDVARLVIPSLEEYQAGKKKVHEILGELPPISGLMELRQERDLAIKAVKAFMFCEQSNGGQNPHKQGTNRHRAFDFGMDVLSMPCAEHVKLHKPAEPKPQPSSISTEPEQLVVDIDLNSVISRHSPDSLWHVMAKELQQWRKWAAAKESK